MRFWWLCSNANEVNIVRKGNFTLPGESGYEKLTLQLAQRWGADVIRDCDGTKLSDEILQAGYGIYSTICPIREHNEWIRVNPESRQQTFLCTEPKLATGDQLSISVMEDFFSEQFTINDTKDGMRYWQVYDRTSNQEVKNWSWNSEQGVVEIETKPWHQYTVSFLAWRIWEEISMYNHVTNDWDKEHLLQLNPYLPHAQAYLRDWLISWCDTHPETTVVRFTSLFYNFAWIWGSNERNRHLFTDWASYDFTVSPAALDDFETEAGYALCAEDFVRQGKYNATHRVPSQKKRDWMTFIADFVREYAKSLVKIVHHAGKQAYVFYDDSWVGLEPYNGQFEEYGFDGMIKCVFSGFEVRLCAGVPAKTHEIRFHPYLFPVGLGGAPTFSKGGKPGKDAFNYWVSTRRALLRQKIERAGLGGYLHLVEEYPDFVEAMDLIVDEFQKIGALHDASVPHTLKPRIGILTAWGALRTWTLSGHFHETHIHVLIHILESLSGLPFEVKFLSFEDIKQGAGAEVDVIINAGKAGSAWSGGECWQDDHVVETLTEWVHDGGIFIGVGEPSAVAGQHTALRMAHVLGLDIDYGEGDCHGRWAYVVSDEKQLIPSQLTFDQPLETVLTSPSTVVLAEAGNHPTLTMHDFGAGKGIYLSQFKHEQAFTKLLTNLLLQASTGQTQADGIADNLYTECAVYPQAEKLAFINNSDQQQVTACHWQGKRYEASLQPYEMQLLAIE